MNNKRDKFKPQLNLYKIIDVYIYVSTTNLGCLLMHMQQYCLFVQCRNVLLSRYCTVEDRRRRHNIYTFPHIVRMSACVCARATIDHVMCVVGGGGSQLLQGPSCFVNCPPFLQPLPVFQK